MRSRFSFITAILFCLTFGPVAHAQPSMGSSSSESKKTSTSRSMSKSTSVLEIIESGGELLLSQFRSQQKSPPVDEPRWNSYESPQETVMTFLEAMRHIEHGRDSAWSRAEKALASSGDTDPKQAARDLKDVFNRLVEIEPEMVPDSRQIQENDIRRYELFPYGVEHEWVWQQAGNAPKGKIVLVPDEDGKWQFNSETVASAADLSTSLQGIPPRDRQDIQGEIFLQTFRPMFSHTPWWGWISLFGGFVIGILLCWLWLWGMNQIHDRLQNHEFSMTAEICRSVAKPFCLLWLVLGILLGSGPVYLGPALVEVRWALVNVLVIIAVGWMLVEIVDLIFNVARNVLTDGDDEYIQMATLLLRRLIRWALGVIVMLMILQNLFEINLTAVLGGLGLATLAISLAAKDAISNMFGALMVFVNRPFLVGDFVEFRDQLGTVEDISLQVTRIRLLTGEVWTVPNMHFIDQPVENYSLRRYYRRIFDIQIIYSTPPEKVLEAIRILEEILNSEEVVEGAQNDPETQSPSVSFSEFGDYSLKLSVYYYYVFAETGQKVQRRAARGWHDYLYHCTLVNKLIVERFNEAGIGFAFPTETVHLENGLKQFEGTEQEDDSEKSTNSNRQ